MYRLVTARQMKEIDRQAIENLGIPGLTLMENAGRGVIEHLEKEVGNLRGKRVAVVCGPGNNGGDGFVCCRYLQAKGADPVCTLLGSLKNLKGDARTNAERLLQAGISIIELSNIADLETILQQADIVIDAIFGTGLSQPPQGLFAQAIAAINRAKRYTVSVDLPSGVDADTGNSFEPAVYADLTVTMALPKFGHVLFPAAAHTGRLAITDIGIPPALLNQGADTFLVDADYVRSVLPPRPADGHKGTFGSCLLICGSPRFSGAACLAGKAAVRSGCGLVRLATPASITPIVAGRVVEAIKLPLPETEEHTISSSALPLLLEQAEVSTSVAVGPGLTTHPSTSELLRDFLLQVTKPVVIDADALNILASHTSLIPQLRACAVLTPHPGELSRLTGIEPARVNADRINLTRTLAKEWNQTLVLKGAPTVTGTPDGKVYVNSTGNCGLASGGTGDVLTGLLAGILATGASTFQAAVAAVFLHGLAADIAVPALTEYCLGAEDLIDYLPAAFRTLTGRDNRNRKSRGLCA